MSEGGCWIRGGNDGGCAVERADRPSGLWKTASMPAAAESFCN